MLTWYAQEQPTSCVAACERMVLTEFGITYQVYDKSLLGGYFVVVMAK